MMKFNFPVRVDGILANIQEMGEFIKRGGRIVKKKNLRRQKTKVKK